MNVIWAIELPRRRSDLGAPPPQVADAPAHHEVDVFAAAGVGEIAVGGVTDDDVLGFALAAEVLFVELAEVHAGLLSHAGSVILVMDSWSLLPRSSFLRCIESSAIRYRHLCCRGTFQNLRHSCLAEPKKPGECCPVLEFS